MREIRFRAWSKINNCMYYGCRGFDFESDGCVYLNVIQADFAADKEPVIMQFTGLYDKNAKPIYEGDVLGNEEGIMGVVHFNAEPGCFLAGMYYVGNVDGMANDWTYEDRCEREAWNFLVIYGNIYEHPELLEATTT